jgi:hypothetical protein
VTDPQNPKTPRAKGPITNKINIASFFVNFLVLLFVFRLRLRSFRHLADTLGLLLLFYLLFGGSLRLLGGCRNGLLLLQFVFDHHFLRC